MLIYLHFLLRNQIGWEKNKIDFSWWLVGKFRGRLVPAIICSTARMTPRQRSISRTAATSESKSTDGCKDTFALKRQMRCRIDADARVHRRGAPSLPLPTGHARATSSSLHGVLRMRRSLLMGASPAAHRWSLPDRARFRRGAAAKAVNGRRRI